MKPAPTIEAGVELDRLVAEILLPAGSWVVSSPRSDNVIIYKGRAWTPSTDIQDAWEVYRLLRAQFSPTEQEVSEEWTCQGTPFWRLDAPSSSSSELWCCGYARPIDYEGESWHPEMSASGETAELAICRAVLVSARRKA